VEITGGTAKSPLLQAQGDQRYPVIKTKPSTFAQLQQSAPEVVAKLNVAATRLNDLLNDNNRRAIGHVLANLDETSQLIAKRSADIDATIANANKTMANLSEATGNLKPQLDNSLDRVNLTVQKYGKVADDADAFINGDGLAQLSDLIGEMRRLVTNLTQVSDQINRTPTKLLFGDRRKGYEPK
jgi:phospholipid/cholesterol/gamma-HCH transport system substrate-binding protein